MMSRCLACVGLALAVFLPGGCMPFGWLYTGPNEPMPAPPAMDAVEKAELDELMVAWDKHYAGLTTLACRFVRWQYEPRSTADGYLRYSAPDKAAIQIEGDQSEGWTCDGKALFEFDNARRRVLEHTLPKDLQGRPIGDGPLPTPLVFAATSRQLRQRYFLRIVTPPGELDRIWLAFYPRFKHDAAVFGWAEMILDRSTMKPIGLQIHFSDGGRTAYRFSDVVIDKPIDAATFHPAPPAGWKRDKDELIGTILAAPAQRKSTPASQEKK